MIGKHRQILLVFGLVAAMFGAGLVLIALQTALLPGGEILRLLVSAALGAAFGGVTSYALSRQTTRRFFATLRKMRARARSKQHTAAQRLNTATRSLQAEIRTNRQRQERTNRLLTALDHDLDLAVRAQHALLRWEADCEHCEAAVLYQPYAAVSGDVYQLWPISAGVCSVFLGDAMGHGISAALVTSILQTTLYENDQEQDVSASLKKLDLALQKLNLDGYTTAVQGQLLPQGEFVWSTAGWPPLLHLEQAATEVHEVRERGLPLGIGLGDASYAVHRCQLQAGDRLLLFSDGLLEWRKDIPRNLDTSALQMAMLQHRALPLSDWLQAIFSTIQEGNDGAPRRDDITAVAIEYQPVSGS